MQVLLKILFPGLRGLFLYAAVGKPAAYYARRLRCEDHGRSRYLHPPPAGALPALRLSRLKNLKVKR